MNFNVNIRKIRRNSVGCIELLNSAISGERILLTAGRPASYDVGISGMPLGGLTEGVRGSHRLAPMMPKGEGFRTAILDFSS